MRDIFISSDFHFNHENIMNFKNKDGSPTRNFSSADEMNEFMIEKHNSVVKHGDIFYCLGDVVMKNKDSFNKLWPRLNGRKRLIVGNHDDIKYLSSGGFFQKVHMWRKFTEYGVLLTHVPVHESVLGEGEKSLINVHGHIHQNDPPVGPYVNVSMEYIDYTPVHIEEIHALHKKQQERLLTL